MKKFYCISKSGKALGVDSINDIKDLPTFEYYLEPILKQPPRVTAYSIYTTFSLKMLNSNLQQTVIKIGDKYFDLKNRPSKKFVPIF